MPTKRTTGTGHLQLLHFLSDLVRKKVLQRAVAKDPVAAMRKYGLSAAQAKALKSGKPRVIAAAVVKEIAALFGQKPMWPDDGRDDEKTPKPPKRPKRPKRKRS